MNDIPTHWLRDSEVYVVSDHVLAKALGLNGCWRGFFHVSQYDAQYHGTFLTRPLKEPDILADLPAAVAELSSDNQRFAMGLPG